MAGQSINIRIVAITYAMLCILVAVPAGIAQGRAQANHVFDKTSPGIRLPYGPPDYLYFGLRRTSPDGKYVARLVCGDGEVGYLAVYKKDMGGWRLLRRGRVSRVFADVNGCAWVPRHGHWLLVSAGGADYGEGLLALWTGKGQTRLLRRAKTPDAAEGFNVRSISPNGRAVNYEHFGENSPDPDDKRNTHFRLALPQS